jgi:hypothetical protein
VINRDKSESAIVNSLNTDKKDKNKKIYNINNSSKINFLFNN